MKPRLCAIIDDRESLPEDLERIVGDIHFGDLLRRRRRYIDELRAACAGADEVIVLRTAADTESLLRRIEAARGTWLWLRGQASAWLLGSRFAWVSSFSSAVWSIAWSPRRLS